MSFTFPLVKEFNDTFKVETRSTPLVRVPKAKLRFGLIQEELKELREAYEACDIVELADAFGDIEYVTIGAAQVFGLADEVEKIVTAGIEKTKQEDELEFEPEDYFSAESHEEILAELREAILLQNVDEVKSILATLLTLNRLYAEHYDVDLDVIVDRIHRSNMTKLDENGEPIFREGDGKVLKGPNYETPTADIELELFAHGVKDADTK
jgi:predicted HAD superfamily Cof-like phosphohydrolase